MTVAAMAPEALAMLTLMEVGGRDGGVKEVEDKGATELGLFFPCHPQDAAKFVTHWRDACIVFVKSNVTVKSVSEDTYK